MQVIQLQFRQLTQGLPKQLGRELYFWIFHAIATHSCETFHVALRDSFPDHFAGKQVGALPHRVANRGRVQQFNRLLRDRGRILEWDQRASAVVQQLDRVPIRSRDDRLARAQCIGKRAGNHLRFIPVGRDVNVGGANELNHFLGTYEAVMEDYLRLHSYFFRQSLQAGPVLVPLATQDVGMGRARDDVSDIGVFRQNLRQRLDYVFDSLVRREQAEREQNRLAFHAEAVLKEIRIQEWQVRNAMRHHVDLAARHLEDFLQELRRELTHDNEP